MFIPRWDKANNWRLLKLVTDIFYQTGHFWIDRISTDYSSIDLISKCKCTQRSYLQVVCLMLIRSQRGVNDSLTTSLKILNNKLIRTERVWYLPNLTDPP